MADPDLARVIDEELALLPDHYREAIVLCELRGLSRKSAATELGIPEGTLSSRLAAAKRKLGERLSARGLSAPGALTAVFAPAGVSAGLVASAVSAARGAAGPVASAAATAVVKAMLFDQLKAVALAAGILLTVVCGGWAMTGTPGGPEPVPAPAPRLADPARELVAKLGAPEFADREAAEKALVALGTKAKPALRAGLASESAEVRERAAKALAAVRRDQIWDVFAKIAGDDKAARDLFARVMSSPRGVAALEAVLDDPVKADEAYRTRTAELMRIAGGHPPVDANGKAGVPTEPDVWAAPPPPLGDIAGWMLLGALQSGNSAWRDYTHADWQQRLSSHVPFLPEDDYTSAKPIAAAYTAADSAPLKKLTAAWLAKRRENDMLRAGLALAIRYDIADALPGVRGVLKTPKPADVSPWNLAAAAVFVGVYGTKDDLPLLVRHAADDRSFGTFLNLPPGTDLRFPPPPEDGRDLFCHVRDAVAATMCKLADKNPADFGFPAFPKTKHPNGAPTSLSSATMAGFKSKADREAAFDKAKAWLKSFQRPEPKKDEPDPAAMKLVEKLGAAEFADREDAAKALEALGEAALPALRAALKSENPELRDRGAGVIRRIERRIETPVDLKLAGHTAHVNGVAFFPDGDKVLTVGDMTYRVWDAKSGKELGRGEQGSEGYDQGGPAAVAPDGKRIAVRYFVTDPATKKFLFGLEGHMDRINRIAYSRDGTRILTASQDGTVRLWRSDFEKELRKIDAHPGKKLPPGPRGGYLPPGFERAGQYEGRGARDAAFSRDGKRIVSGGDDGTVRVWDTDTGKELAAMTLDKVVVTSVAFLSGEKVVSGGGDGIIRVWDVETGKELKQFKGHTDWVNALAVTGDAARVVSVSHDGTARVWDAETGKELRCYRGHTGQVYSVAVAPDGRTAVTGGADNTARVWSLPPPAK